MMNDVRPVIEGTESKIFEERIAPRYLNVLEKNNQEQEIANLQSFLAHSSVLNLYSLSLKVLGEALQVVFTWVMLRSERS